MASFHDRNYQNEMAKGGRRQPVFEGSHNSPSPTGRHINAVPARPPWGHRAQLSRSSQPDPSSPQYRSHFNETDYNGRSREEIRGWGPSTRPTQISEMIALQGSQSSPSFAGRHMDMGSTQRHMSTHLMWRESPEEMARDSQNSLSPTGRHMDICPTRSRTYHFDDMSRRVGSDAAIRGLQNCPSPLDRRLPGPHGPLSTSHEDRKFSVSSSLQTDGGDDFECKCPKEPPRPRNSFMLYRQHHQSSVAKDNKGSSNPEISKIIGSMWKCLGEDEREIWTQRAEEEKKLHALKYPGYRYKPNRRPKAQGKQNWRCNRCGGRQNKTTRSAESPGSPHSPESAGSSHSSPSSRTPRIPRGRRGSQGHQDPRTPRTPRTLPTPITPFAASSEIMFTTPMSSSTGHRNSELFPWLPMSAPNSSARRQIGITPSLHRISEQREPRSPRDDGSASPDRRRRRTNDAGDYCSTGHGFDTGRRPDWAELTAQGRLAMPAVPVPEPAPASFPRSQSLSTLPPLPRQPGTDPRRDSLFGDPPRLPALEPPLPQTPSWPFLGNYSIHKRFEEKS
ncbi:hypothetical protein V8C35DRAFT_182362 [Trichoderma chlorosporum]